jgi:hypothetical protein
VKNRGLLLIAFAIPFFLQAQTLFRGTVISRAGKPIPYIEVHAGFGDNLAVTDSLGKFSFDYAAADVYSFVGYIKDKKIFGYRIPNNAKNAISDTIIEGSGMDVLPAVRIETGTVTPPFFDEIRPRDLQLNPSIGGGVESIIKTLGGVSSGNELSSQYNVRGGNFDENLIYVNDIEIYRPQLIHSGQQEGLSFINPDLVKSLRFSAGGFEAQFGDKMSSVLDVTYVKPDSFGARVNLGVMLNSISVEGSSKRLKWIAGVRYYSNSLLTRSLDLKGSYSMNFADVQTLISYQIRPRWTAEFLGNMAANRYTLYPESRKTEFGTIQEAYQLDVFMAGAENMQYDYGMGALTVKFQANSRKEYKWFAGVTGSNESENFDVEGAYYLSLLDRDIGSSTLGEPLKTLGFGYYLDHGRNSLQTKVFQFGHSGVFGKTGDKYQIKYGVRASHEMVQDKYKEWRYEDSDYYNVPQFGFASDTIVLADVVNARNQLSSWRGQAYIQERYRLNKANNMWLGAGVRASWWEVNQELFITPRANFSYEPNKAVNKRLPDSLKKNDVIIKVAVGAYYQPGFYRELRGFDGTLNTQLKAQRSWHFVAGMDRFFNMWDRRFKLSTEGYYKTMAALNPYLYDNIRIRYYANNNSEGYVAGIDNRVNGEFVKGLESWFTLSFLQSKERITYTDANGELRTTDWLRRPTDRRMNFAAVFQDELPSNPTFRVNINLLIGSALPYYLGGNARYSQKPGTIPPYRRLDLGMSKILKGAIGPRGYKGKHFKAIKEAWISLEVFNLLGINNVIAYSWVNDLNNRVYGIPEYLTGRRLNLRLHASF